MRLNKVYVSTEASQQLNMLRQRTGLKPNVACRLGFCLSLEEYGIPSLEEFGGKSEREFNWSTLFGQRDLLYMAYLRQRLEQDDLDLDTHLEQQLYLHLNRGVFLLFKRVRQIEDIGSLLEQKSSSVESNEEEELLWE
jgi:DNA sulfur modification protein DndE